MKEGFNWQMTLITILPPTPFKEKNVLTFLIGTVIYMHTGKFAQNFFHISVILGCIPLLFLQFWVKDYKNKPLTILEVIKETLGFILKIMKKIARWRHNQKISIKSMKTKISPLFLHFWSRLGYQKKQKISRNSNLLVWSANF